MRNWNRVGLCPGGQTPEILPMKAGKSIGNVVMNARNMLRGESKLKWAAADSKRQRRRIIQGTLDVLESKMRTTTWLSNRKRTWHQNHWETQTYEATTTGKSSL